MLAVGLLGDDASGLPLLPNGPGLPLLGEHARGWFTRPHLRGQRDGGRDWSTRFTCTSLEEVDSRLRIELLDDGAGLGLVTEVEPVPGGALRLRHTLTNQGADGYSLAALEVVLPAADHLVEMLDFTGRHERERNPQRRESPTASGCASPAPDGPAWVRPRWPCSAPRASPPPTGRCWPSTWGGAETPCCGSSETRRPAPRSVVASCSFRARSGWRTARATRRRGCTSPPPTTASTAWPPPGTPTSGACPPTQPNSRWC